MFFYRFSYFISLVANVAKKSLESFWDRKLLQTVCMGRSRARGVLEPFFLVTAGILVTGPQRLRRRRGLHVPWADHRQQGGGEGREAQP